MQSTVEGLVMELLSGRTGVQYRNSVSRDLRHLAMLHADIEDALGFLEVLRVTEEGVRPRHTPWDFKSKSSEPSRQAVRRQMQRQAVQRSWCCNASCRVAFWDSFCCCISCDDNDEIPDFMPFLV
mmetsp:Transcript_29250/g.56694  ORF Transcript_29250/g.56694 Transcript_29250/m.56694 type:complete len:125 (-) Transcript_29250:66-440(-)